MKRKIKHTPAALFLAAATLVFNSPAQDLDVTLLDNAHHSPENSKSLTLWYRQPAGADWNSALPIGNGRLGAMVYGGVNKERLQLNEDTIWEGYKRDGANSNALTALPEVRRLLFEG